MADQVSMLASGVEGYFLSPEEADALEASLTDSAWDEISRWKLLGFFSAHELCCTKYRARRVKRIVEMIDRQKSIEDGSRNLLSLSLADKGSDISAVRAAWQRRIDAEPDNFVIQENMAYFLMANNPADAGEYFKRALHLIPEEKQERRWLLKKFADAAEKLSKLPQPMFEDEERTCFFQVISQAEKLLADLRSRTQLQPHENWENFETIIHTLVHNPTMLVFSQHRNDVPLNGSAEVIFRHTLTDMYKLFSAKTAEGKTLRSEPYKTYWTELLNSSD